MASVLLADWLGDPPASASWPRLCSGPNPRAVGSYGPEMLAWCERRRLNPRESAGWRWWQKYVACRALEHDAEGRLVWDRVVVSTRRQSGKSWLERGVLAWRLHQSRRFGQQQAILHVAHKLLASQEVWRPAALWALAEYGPDSVRWTNGQERIELPDGSRWMIQAATDGAGVAFALTAALVDEAWRVPLYVVDGALAPTLAEADSPQLWLVSTAGDSASELMRTYRAAALATAELDDPGSTLICEWSAPPDPDLDIDDPGVWRASSPYWDERIGTVISRERLRVGEFEFRQQWLNQWTPTLSSGLFTPETWRASSTSLGPVGVPCFGVDVAPDRGAAAVLAAGGGLVEVVRADAGVGWVAGEVLRLVERWDPPRVVADPAGPAVSVVAELAPRLGSRLVAAKAREVVAACAGFYDQVVEQTPTHRPHPVLDEAAGRARRRRAGGSWVFDRDDGGHVLVAAALAHWADRQPAPAAEMSQIW